MRVRFGNRTVGLRTGPQYNAGEVALLPDDLGQELLALGLVERLDDEAPTAPAALDAPPADRAMKRGGVVRR